VLDTIRECVGGTQDGSDVDAVGISAIGTHALRAAMKQGDGAAAVAAMCMRQPDRNLGEALPEVAFGFRAGLPQIFEYLVRMKWAPRTEQFVR
jgi:hypothetical protein